ncbi:DNA polymerase alpha subunit B [Serendipita indica DSM 11827]|nr:DNA polymerase alpha subunit B [Serendipita indica DSM 11827]
MAQELDERGLTLLRKDLAKGVQTVMQSKKPGAISARKPQGRPIARQAAPSTARRPQPMVKSDHGQLKILDNLKERHYRYMHERIAERSTVLDDRIDEFAELVRTHYKLEDIGDPASTSDEDVIVVGRICCDGDTKLNEASVELETSRLMGAGARVALKFDPNVSSNGDSSMLPLYPGAIVALKGRNETGSWFQVSQILMLPLLPLDIDSNRQEHPISMAIAAGPFSGDDLQYTHFDTFLQTINGSAPNWILLIGPFVDVNNPRIREGDVDLAPNDLFRQRILSPLRTFLDAHPGTTALIVSSVRDLISHHAVYPQPPLQLPQSSRIVVLPNPCTFTIDHVRFSVTSVDVLFHLQRQLLRKKVIPTGTPPPIDQMSILGSCVLEQRSFYPLFPAEPELHADVNLDVSHSELLKLEDVAPDVLILPSNLGKFHKVVHGTTVINPAFASKGVHATLNISSARSSSGGVSDRSTVNLHSSVSMTAALDLS